MASFYNLFKYTIGLVVLAVLVLSSSFLGVLLYGRISGQDWVPAFAVVGGSRHQLDSSLVLPAPAAPAPTPAPTPEPRKTEARLSAPAISQMPELRSGCELTSLTMLLQFAGIQKGKMELVPELTRDTTPIRWKADGTVAYWGHPNVGYVGDITGRNKGFGVYHKPLLAMLETYLPNGLDLTGQPFEVLEDHVASGIPVVAWTTINFKTSVQWMTWETPSGPVTTTFSEHAVLLVGFDDQYVYVNDPLTGQADVRVEKDRFLTTWEMMGKQAITYKPAES
ncbi:hypothetical protein J31TS4_30410 [Paenibacillus sp. J31TS4]|uniref:C39 family peptidase n=1 Tax=Paenibacillus sp. J31TS4 TaxID=2807195 RepID=UPI001B1C21D3|nr:C39 family peptidase [Paenibacillus sp. J31TS4]GIP39761.1 hypothetical protein J31TS4_30410 [Paenibacillus sp. J31TS4]